MSNDLDLPAWLLDPPRRAANDDAEGAFDHLDALGMMRLCKRRLAERGDWDEAARIARELAPYIHERRPNVNVSREPVPAHAPRGTEPAPRNTTGRIRPARAVAPSAPTTGTSANRTTS